MMRRVWAFAASIRSVIVRMIGVPDYDAYVAHLAASHPGTAPLSRERFVSERLTERYSKPGAKCC